MLKEILIGKSPKKTLVRLVLFVIPITYILASWVFIPVRIKGISMEPTMPDGSWSIIVAFNRPLYRGAIVAIRMAGGRVAYLKRIVGVPGDTVAFKKGKLYVNGKLVDEPYVKYPCNWDMEARTVPACKVYVVGDNRSMLITTHVHGLTDIDRIMGSPIF